MGTDLKCQDAICSDSFSESRRFRLWNWCIV